MHPFKPGDKVVFEGATWTWMTQDGANSVIRHPHGYDISVPTDRLALEEQEPIDVEELIHQVIKHDAAEILPSWIVPQVTDVLDDWDEFPPESIVALAKALHNRYETQFDPKLIAHLKEWGAIHGPNGVALAAAALTPWPALGERLIAPPPTLESAPAGVNAYLSGPEAEQRERERLAIVRDADLRLSYLRDLAGVLSAPANVTWKELISQVQSLRTVAAAGPEEMSKALLAQVAAAEDDQESQSWPEILQKIRVRRTQPVQPHANWTADLARALGTQPEGVTLSNWQAMLDAVRNNAHAAHEGNRLLILLQRVAATAMGLTPLASFAAVRHALEQFGPDVEANDFAEDLVSCGDADSLIEVARLLLEKYRIVRRPR